MLILYDRNTNVKFVHVNQITDENCKAIMTYKICLNYKVHNFGQI